MKNLNERSEPIVSGLFSDLLGNEKCAVFRQSGGGKVMMQHGLNGICYIT